MNGDHPTTADFAMSAAGDNAYAIKRMQNSIDRLTATMNEFIEWSETVAAAINALNDAVEPPANIWSAND